MTRLITGVLSLLVIMCLPLEIHAADPYEAFSAIRSPKKASPGFSLPQVNGETVRLSDFKGKVVLLGFFKTF